MNQKAVGVLGKECHGATGVEEAQLWLYISWARDTAVWCDHKEAKEEGCV